MQTASCGNRLTDYNHQRFVTYVDLSVYKKNQFYKEIIIELFHNFSHDISPYLARDIISPLSSSQNLILFLLAHWNPIRTIFSKFFLHFDSNIPDKPIYLQVFPPCIHKNSLIEILTFSASYGPVYHFN